MKTLSVDIHRKIQQEISIWAGFWIWVGVYHMGQGIRQFPGKGRSIDREIWKKGRGVMRRFHLADHIVLWGWGEGGHRKRKLDQGENKTEMCYELYL